MDEPTRAAVDRWLSKAQRDLVTAQTMLASNPPLTDIVCFHSQQCAEKALKAFLVAAGVHVDRTHYLPRLLELCRDADDSFGQLAEDATSLTDYAVATRYPDVDEPDPTEDEARAATAAAERVLTFARTANHELIDLPCPGV